MICGVSKIDDAHWVCGFCGAREGQNCPESRQPKPAPCESTRMWVDETGYAWNDKPK